MTNKEYIAKVLTEGDPFDDGYASYEAVLHYNIRCPYFGGDKRAHCYKDNTKVSRDFCYFCKREWLNQEVDP